MSTKVTISKGNNKLGNIPSFSLPAITSCPGKTSWCASKCYAHKLMKIYPNVKTSYMSNMFAANEPGFVTAMNKELNKLSNSKKGLAAFRIHVSGDYFSNEYIEKWIQIINNNQNITFYAYTRSWEVPELLVKLEELRALPNMTLFASTDITTQTAPPATWRIAYAGDSNPGMIACLEQSNSSISTCEQCKLCFNPGLKNSYKVSIYFKTH